MTTTIGQRLKAAREEQRLTLEKVFESTRIRVQYLQALEDDDLSIMPSPVQARGYLRNYAEFLGLDVAKLLEELLEASKQKPSEVVIGPADVPEINQAATPEPLPASMEPAPVEEPPALIKSKPARRKKKDAPPLAEIIVPADPPSHLITDAGHEIQIQPPDSHPGQDGEQIQKASPGKKAHRSRKPLNKVEMVSFLESSRELQETVPADVPHVPVETLPAEEQKPVPDIQESLWQTWLNRLGSVLTVRSKRRTPEVNEPVPSAAPLETDSLPVVSLEQTPPDTGTPDLQGSESTENSNQIFKEIGRELRERRELLSLHLEEVERNTRVKAHYLDALERGAMDELPSTVQTRGMLSNYATFLDLDVDALLLRFADALQARYRERNPQRPVRKPGQPIVANLPPMRSFIAGDLIFGVGIGLLLVGFAIWGVSRVLTLQGQQEVEATAPSISEILLAPSEVPAYTATAPERPVEAFPGQATITVVIPTLNADVNVQVNLIAAERAYMRVIADGEVVFEGRVMPGTAYPFEAESRVEVLVGNGAAIRVVYNGRDLGLLGSFGQVVNNIYQANEIVTPTGLPTSTATITPTPTRTPVPSATSRFTATPGTPAPTNTAVP